jgi:hypothetical protein
MNRVGGIGERLRRPGRQAVARRLLAALPVLPASAHAQTIGAGPQVVWPTLLSFALAVVALGVGAAVAVRVARSHARLMAQLREARGRTSCLEPLLDAWLWQSDAQHRIVSMRPPHGAVTAEWSKAPDATPLQAHFTGTVPAALEAMLANAVAFDDVEVQFDPTGSRPCSGLLRGRPYTDATGGFAGYLGTFSARSSPLAAQPVTAAAAALPVPAADYESFNYTVSHDLRAPIRVVEGFTKIVKEDYGRLLDRVGNDHLDRVLGAAARMNNMIDALLALSKLSSQPLAHQPVNLSQLAGYVADDLRRQWPDRAVQLEIQPDMQVQGDPTLLRVVVENLLGNAWKYTGKSAQANISFTRHAKEPDTFAVVDNGAGFDMRFADRLFGVFQRLHSANDFPGTGIGLASVRRIVRRHGGEIWGEAEVNRGARFHFSLPQQGGMAG